MWSLQLYYSLPLSLSPSIAADTQINIERRDIYAIWGVNAAWEALDES